MTLVLEVFEELYETGDLATQLEVPSEVLEAFGDACKSAGLVNEDGCFNDARKVVRFICSPPPQTRKEN